MVNRFSKTSAGSASEVVYSARRKLSFSSDAIDDVPAY